MAFFYRLGEVYGFISWKRNRWHIYFFISMNSESSSQWYVSFWSWSGYYVFIQFKQNKKKDFKSRRFPYLSTLISPPKFHFLNAYSEKTKSVTPHFYNRFRYISVRTTTMQKMSTNLDICQLVSSHLKVTFSHLNTNVIKSSKIEVIHPMST